MEYTLKIKRLKTPTDANWVTTISGGYMDIKGRVYDFSRARDGQKKADGTLLNPFDDENGYWKASVELTGLINPFTNPISNAVVKETRIEAAYTADTGWGSQIPGDNYFEYIARSCIDTIKKRYKDLYGVEIDLSFVKIPDPPKEEPVVTAPITASASGPSASTTTTTEITAATNSTTGASASGASASSSIDGEFTFNVEQESLFIGNNNQFGTLSIIGIGEIKDEPIEKPVDEEIPIGVEDEVIDEEYSEEEYKGEAEIDPNISAVNQYSAMQMINEAEASRDTTEADKTFTATGVTISGKLNTTPDKGKGFGIIGKKMADKDLLKAMVDYIEGGYYYPGHAYSQFNESSRKLYGSSGETLWGIDRHAGQTENSSLGKKFWAAVDNLSGYGSTTGKTGYAKKTNTRSWDSGTYPTKSGAWKYNYMPSKKDAGFDTMYNSFVEYASGHCHDWLDKYFKDHPVKAMILSDARMKFMWFRATWNGPGWFSWYVNGKKGSAATTGLKWAYDNVSKNVDDLILWDLNNRLKFGNQLITHDVKKMAKLIGIKG